MINRSHWQYFLTLEQELIKLSHFVEIDEYTFSYPFILSLERAVFPVGFSLLHSAGFSLMYNYCTTGFINCQVAIFSGKLPAGNCGRNSKGKS